MRNLKKLALTAFSISVLAACSSGGKNGDNGAVSTSSVVSQSQYITVNTSTNTSTTGTNSATSATLLQQNTGALEINGTVYPLAPTGYEVSRANLVQDSTDSRTTYYGYVVDKSGLKHAFAGSTLAETTTLPTSGVIYYEGDVVYSYGGRGDNQGDADLWVDFANKKVTGTFEDSAYGNASVQANISGSGFTGTVTAGATQADLKGTFYGTNASSLGGVFGNSQNTLNGAFGADR